MDTLVDENDGINTGGVSLRDAVAYAATLPGTDTIYFSPDLLDATIALTHGELVINSDVVIVGGQNRLTIDAQRNSRVFVVNSGKVATISGLTITGGGSVDVGAGIYNYQGDLTLDSVRVTDNKTRQLSINVVSNDQGGGINSYNGSLHILNSEIDANEARWSAGIVFYANDANDTLEITNSVMHSNIARDVDGWGAFGGLKVSSTTTDADLKIINSTFSGNKAGATAGIRVNSNVHLEVVNSTITNNEAVTGTVGGFEINGSGALVTMHNTIVAGNIDHMWSGFNADVSQYLGSFASSSSHNLIGRPGSTGFQNGVNGNLVGSTGSPLSPGLALLGNYGGLTPTHILMAGSMAIDHGNAVFAVGLETDQRGYDRVVDGNQGIGVQVDIGAVEMQFATNASLLFESNGTPSADIVIVTNDTVTVNGQVFVVTLADQINIYAFGGNDVVDASATTKVVRLFGGDGDDQLYGGDGFDWLYGGTGNDELDGGGGLVDKLYGGEGDDRYFVDNDIATSAHVSDTSGVDTLDFSAWNGPSGVTVALSATPFVGYWIDSTHTVSLRLMDFEAVENAIGTAYNDQIIGTSLANIIEGGGGDDVLYGGGGDDILDGGSGNDHLDGGDGTDTLDGGPGEDEFPVNTGESYADDDYGDSDQVPAIEDQIGNINHPPRMQPIANRTVDAGSPLEFQVFANDIDEESSNLQFSFVGPSHGATLSSSGFFSWTPSWQTAEETEFDFRVQVTDSGQPVLRNSQEFSVRVLPISPRGLRIFGANGSIGQTVWIEWDPLDGATGYILERRAWDENWTQVADTSNTIYRDLSYPLVAVEYRVRARTAFGELAPFSDPVQDYFTFAYTDIPNLSPYVTPVANGNLVQWRPMQGPDWDFTPVVTDYIVERAHSSSDGWIEILHAPVESIQFDGEFFSFVDQSASQGTAYEYGVIEVADGLRTNRFASGTGPLVLDLTFLSENYYRSPPQLRDVPDAEEESKGYFIPLNNNFDEHNLDADGDPVRDNEEDTSNGHRATIRPQYPVTYDRQLTILSVERYGFGISINELTFEFPPSIKIWAFAYGGYDDDPIEIESGTTYSIYDLHEFGREFHVEGIEESQTVRDVEIKVTATNEFDASIIEIDKLRLTVGDLRAELVAEVDADTAELLAYLPIAPYADEFDGEAVTLNLRRNSTLVESQEATIEDGQVTAAFSTRRVANDEYTVETVFRGQRGTSDVVKLIAGSPHTIETVATKTKYTADGTDTITITATVRDQFGNLVDDGTAIDWSMGFGDGTFVDSGAATATQTTNGLATITLRAPDVPGVQHVVIAAGEASSALDIVAEAADFEINGVADLDIATGESGVVTITNANVADGTPVFWTLSNGEISGGEYGGRVFEGTVENGTASIGISATGPWARYGQAIVTATVAGHLHHHVINFYRSGGFSVELERFLLSGNKIANGFETLVYQNPNPTYNGQPVWGFGPPLQQWPAPKNVQYFAETPVTIHGTPGQTYYIDPTSSSTGFLPLGLYADLIGLGASNQITLNGAGLATFTVRSKGLLASGSPSDFVPVQFAVREGSPFVGAPERTERVMLVEHNWWTRTWDAAQSFIGGDPQTAAGIGANVAGGMLIVGDVGSLVKNGWRMTPLSDTDPNYTEAVLSGFGLGTELAVGFGEAADGPISAARALAAASKGSKFAEILGILVKRGFANAQDMAKFGKFLLKLGTSDVVFQAAKKVFTSEQLFEAGIRAVDKLGDVGGKFIERVAHIAEGPGIKIAQDVTTLFGKLSDNALDFFKQLNPSQLEDALGHIATVLQAGKVDIAQLRKLLDHNLLFTAAYNRSMMLRDLSILSDSEGIGKLVNHLKSETLAGPIQGRLYELQIAANLVNEHSQEGWKLNAIVSKYAKEVDPITGKRLASSDIDFIIDDGTDLIYYQAKSSATAFGNVADAQRWVEIVRKDAERNGVTNQVIRYVTPNPDGVPEAVKTFLNGQGIPIEPSPLLQ